MPIPTFNACLFVDEHGGTPSEDMPNEFVAYRNIETMLLMYIARFDFETDVRPFQLRYRRFHLYGCDIGGWQEEATSHFMESLGRVVLGRPSRVYLFWTGETHEAFERTNPKCRGLDTCINVCDRDWMERTDLILRKLED